MKHIKFTILTALLFMASNIFAQQPNLIHSGNKASGIVLPQSDMPIYKYLYLNNSTKSDVVLDFYTAEDFQFHKQIKFTAATQQHDSIVDAAYLSYDVDLLFVRAAVSDAGYYGNDKENLKLYNGQGKILYDFGNAYLLIGNASGALSQDKLLILIVRYTYNDQNQLQIVYEYYTLSIPSGNSLQSVTVEKKMAFPCPAKSQVTIPTTGRQGDLRILNIKGQVIESQPIQGGEYQQINTSSFPAGTYIYQVGNETGKFIVE